MEFNLPYPDIRNRRAISRYDLNSGSVVAFLSKDCGRVRTGIIVMESRNWMLLAVNLYEDEGYFWYSDELPNDIHLYEANEEEKIWGLKYYLEYYYTYNEAKEDNEGTKEKFPLICLIDAKCHNNSDRTWYWSSNLHDFLLRAPYLIDRAQWSEYRSALGQRIKEMSGLQYERNRIENYCFLIGTLMIAESEKDESKCKEKILFLYEKWDIFSWMYGIGIGRVVGSKLHNFTSVINQICQSDRKYYLHLYLPLVESFTDKIFRYNDDKPEKLQGAIRKAKEIEAREKQETDLDELFNILFPQQYIQALLSNRPAATIAEMHQKIEAQEEKISELENRLSSTIIDFNRRYEALLHSFEAMAKASVTFDEIKNGLASLSRTTAEGVLEKLSITLADNKRFMYELPKLRDFIKSNEKPTEVHNHFEAGSSNQVFNGEVNSNFEKK